MDRRHRTAAGLAVLALFVAGGCSSSKNASDSGEATPALPTKNQDNGGGSGGSSGGSAAGDDEDAGLPAEVKAEDNFKAPVATGKGVYSIKVPRSHSVKQ